MRARLTLTAGTAALALAGSVFGASPASAAADTTDVTFTLAAGALTIANSTTTATLTQAAGTIGTGGTSVSGKLGATTVSDLRGGLANAATVVVTSTPFTVDGDTAGDATIPASAATAFSGAASNVSGTAVPAATVAAPAGENLDSGSTIFTMASVGSGSAQYDPTVTIAVPANAVAGTAYTGTITQTVS
jgi:hypothetical protein